ncbi:MAG: hypothetical protein AVDCRST_MAG89-1922, partial [uncultured Gemmatimonadetes bacterium]
AQNVVGSRWGGRTFGMRFYSPAVQRTRPRERDGMRAWPNRAPGVHPGGRRQVRGVPPGAGPRRANSRGAGQYRFQCGKQPARHHTRSGSAPYPAGRLDAPGQAYPAECKGGGGRHDDHGQVRPATIAAGGNAGRV